MISADNEKYLDEIANRLFTNHAAIMIGAGFSKNATSISQLNKTFPDWNELGDAFYEKLYGKDSVIPEKKYLNVLKLAEEVEATYGRSELDRLIRNNIPDAEYEPSSFHQKLLALPWTDVFTTNYDTLLERAAKHVFNRKYTTVYSKDDLVDASKPRIVKLHGNFHSDNLFTITEEDYRVYPKTNAPFVNTVQQSLLENTLCLIGFSGDDPNFLQWIGWLRDNLENDASKIYLIGSFNLSSSQIKLLDKRHIVQVNLADNHRDALNIFIDYLSKRARTNNILRWPYNGSNAFTPETDNIEKSIMDTLSIWKHERETYPGWVVLPEEKRSFFWKVTEFWRHVLLRDGVMVNEEIQFRFVFELCWRLDKCLFPMDEHVANLVKRVLNNNYDSNEKITLGIYLLRFYRQNGKFSDWNDLYRQLDVIENLSSKSRGELDYENALCALFHLDYPKLKNIVQEWNFPRDSPFENVKKAGLLAEAGQLQKAIGVVEQALVTIREQQVETVTSSTNCELLSQESYILCLYQNLIFADRNYSYSIEGKKEFLDRMSTLKSYLCDPFHEYDYFELLLSPDYKKQKDTEYHHKYDIGEATVSYHRTESYNEQRNAFAFLLFCEKIGRPFCIHNGIGLYDFSVREAKSAIARISEYNLIWAIIVCCRIADRKAADTLFSRKAINTLSIEAVNGLCGGFIITLNENKNDILTEETNGKNFAQVLAKILPEIISRMTPKCNTDVKSRILKLIGDILLSECRYKYENVDNLIKRFVKSLLPVELEMFFQNLLELPIPQDISVLEEGRLLSPFEYLRVDKDALGENIKFEKKLLVPYFNALNSNQITIRKWGFITLARLYEYGFLDDAEQRVFANNLWSKLDSAGFPFVPYYSHTCFVNLPYPLDKDPLKILKKDVMVFPCWSFITLGRISTQNIPQITRFFEAVNCLLTHNVLNEREIVYLIGKILLFWENNKQALDSTELEDEFKPCFYQMMWSLGKLLKCMSGSYDADKIRVLLQDLEQHDLSCLYLRLVINDSDIRKTLKARMAAAIASKDPNRRKDALCSLGDLIFTEISEDEFAPYFRMLVYSVLYEEHVNSYLNIDYLIFFVDKRNVLAKTFKWQIIAVLNHLATITDYADEDSLLSFDEKLIVRQRTMLLASVVKKNLDAADEEVEIARWESVASDENEFSDIRNKWM